MPALAPPSRKDPSHVLDNLMKQTDGDPSAAQIVESIFKIPISEYLTGRTKK